MRVEVGGECIDAVPKMHRDAAETALCGVGHGVVEFPRRIEDGVLRLGAILRHGQPPGRKK
jgi:hypothetical protein